jgi:phosphate starvation-inducible PhoH-like protein
MADKRRDFEEGGPEVAELRYEFGNRELFFVLCGFADSGIKRLGSLLNVDLVPRGHSFLIRSTDMAKVEEAGRFFEALSDRYKSGDALPEPFDTDYIHAILQSAESEDVVSPLKEKVFTTFRGKPIFPKTLRQADFVQSLLTNPVTICTGPAGTGKTFLGIAIACRLLLKNEVERIILTRPAVEAGESLGFLPGDLTQKVDPYLRPVYDALYDCIGMDRVYEMIAARKIEIAPLAYMRGRTLNDSFILLDEAQNCTLSQIKMFLTRLGKNSRMCVGGDLTQIDLSPGKSGLARSIRFLEGIREIGIVRFGREDIVRNPLVEKIVKAFEEGEDAKDSSEIQEPHAGRNPDRE